MSATCSRVSWVDLCNEADEEEANRQKWIEPASVSVVVNNVETSTPTPTPSKQLGDCLNNLHMITPLKDITVNEPIIAPIQFNLEDKLNPNESGEQPEEDIKETKLALQENDNVGESNIDDKNKRVLPQSVEEKKQTNQEPINSVEECQILEYIVKSSSAEYISLPPMELAKNKRDDSQSSVRENQNSKFDDSRKRTRRNSASSSATTSDSPRSKKANYELELDPGVIKRRQKQIDFGKNTLGYDSYIKSVPKDKRSKNDPTTPPKHLKYSRRAFDGLVKIWRQELHKWDPKNENEDNINSDSESDEPSLDESLLLTD